MQNFFFSCVSVHMHARTHTHIPLPTIIPLLPPLSGRRNVDNSIVVTDAVLHLINWSHRTLETDRTGSSLFLHPVFSQYALGSSLWREKPPSGPLVLWSSSALQVISLSEQTDIFRFSHLSKGLDVIRFADVVLWCWFIIISFHLWHWSSSTTQM